MSELEDKAVDLLDKFENLAEQYAPDVINAATEVVRVSSIGNLIFGVVSCFFVCIAVFTMKKMLRYIKEENHDEVNIFITFIIGGVVIVLFSITVLTSLLDIWNWVAIFNPELALAHKLLGL